LVPAALAQQVQVAKVATACSAVSLQLAAVLVVKATTQTAAPVVQVVVLAAMVTRAHLLAVQQHQLQALCKVTQVVTVHLTALKLLQAVAVQARLVKCHQLQAETAETERRPASRAAL